MDTAQQNRFLYACDQVLNAAKTEDGIGTYKEKTIHAILKYYYAPNPLNHERRINGFIADIQIDDKIIEIQTRGFHTLRNKLKTFLEQYQVTIVFPIVHKKVLRWINPSSGEISAGRKSPKTGSKVEIFPELYRIKSYLTHPNLTFCPVLLDVEEFRVLDGWSKDKKRGSSRNDGIPTSLIDEVTLHSPSDYQIFIPCSLSEPFTSLDYKKAAKLNQNSSALILNILHYLGLVERVGKEKNFYLYCRSKNFFGNTN